MERNEAFRTFLQRELIKRTKANSSFSLRSFAKQLEIEPSSLSQILNSKRTLTDKMVHRLSAKLNLTAKDLKNLTQEHEFISNPYIEFNKMSLDHFQMISEWYHFAILELTALDHFEPKISWISKVLGISYVEANDAIKRLIDLGHLTIENGKWIDTLGDSLNQGNEYTDQAFRNYQKDVLNKAIHALENINYTKRVQSSLVFPVAKSKLPEAKKRILNFMEELSEFLREGDKEEIYHMNLSLYPITDSEKGVS